MFLIDNAQSVRRSDMRSRRFYTSLVFLMAASTSSVAATPPPELPLDPHAWQKTTLKEKPTGGISIGALRVQFERTTLDDVRRAASVGEVSHQGDAGESIYWLCYTNEGTNPVERIWVIAHGEIGGSRHAVTRISAQTIPNEKATSNCPSLPVNLMPLSLDHNLWLNSSESDALKVLGAPSYHNRSWRSYYWQDRNLDSSGWLWVETQQGRVTSLHAGQVTGF